MKNNSNNDNEDGDDDEVMMKSIYAHGTTKSAARLMPSWIF